MSNPLENALQRGTFNVLDAVRGRGYPTDTVTVYTAVEAAYEAKKIQVALGDETDPDKVAELESSLEDCLNQIKASALRFHLRGLPPGVVESIEEEAIAKTSDPEDPLAANNRARISLTSTLAASIVKVEDAEGNVDEREKWTAEDVEEMFSILPDTESGRLIEKMTELTFQSAVFDEVVGPDFSLRR